MDAASQFETIQEELAYHLGQTVLPWPPRSVALHLPLFAVLARRFSWPDSGRRL